MRFRPTFSVRALLPEPLPARRWHARSQLLLLAVFLLPGSIRAQNYGSHMNSAERARESQRYEAALLNGTYNNPMLQKSTVDPSMALRGIGQAQRDADAAKFEQQQAEQRRRYEEQAEKERRAATEAYYQARRAEAQRERSEFERNYAAIGVRRWGYQDLTAMPSIAQNRERVRTGKLDAIPPLELYATALALRRSPAPAAADGAQRSPEYPVAQLALQALARGQMLPAVLLADELLPAPDFLRQIAFEGTEFDRLMPVYYTGGHGWIAEDEFVIAQRLGLVSARQLADAADMREQIKTFRFYTAGQKPRDQVLKVFGDSRLFPWQADRARRGFFAQEELGRLRESRPVLGYFMSALYEERLRLDPARPSPWADFIFERAAQLAPPGFVTEVARVRREASSGKEAAVFLRWMELQTSGATTGFGALDAHALWRVAGRLILGHDLADLTTSLTDRTDPATITRRLTLAHDMLWELTTRGERHALLIQYLAAMQDETAPRPSLHAYLNAYHWVLDWDRPPAYGEETAMVAASFLEVLPVSRLGRYYPDSATAKALEPEVPESLKQLPYAMLGHGSWLSTGYLENLPLQAVIAPAVILHRQRGEVESTKLFQLGNTIRPAGFGARLARQLQVAAAGTKPDPRLAAVARERLALVADAKAAPALNPGELDRGLQRFGEAALTLSGSSLLCEPLPLAAASDSESLLEAVALRNLALKTFLPHVRLLPLPQVAFDRRLRADSALRRTVAVQALGNLDDTYAVGANLRFALAIDWVKAGAAQGDVRCQLRLAQIALRGGPLAGVTNLTVPAAEKILTEAVETGVPGAIEFQFERLRGQSKSVPPEQLFAFVHAARAKGSPLAAQAWLDALDETPAWSAEQAVQETIALRMARDDMRDSTTDRWWKALGRWSTQLRTHRSLFVGRPEADQLAREVTRLVQQCDSLADVYPRERLHLKAYDIFPHLATASGNLPPSPAMTGLREALTSSRHVRDELRYGSFVPLEAALHHARTEKDPLAREFAAADAARWYAVNPRSRVENAGLVIFSLLPAEPDRHPLWDPALAMKFTAAALSVIWNGRALPEEFTGNIRKVAGLVERLPGASSSADRQALVNGYAHFTYSAQNHAGIRARPEAGALVAAFDRIAQQQAEVAAEIYRASARIATRTYALAVYDRMLRPAGEWISLHRECYNQLTAADHVAHLRRILQLEAKRVDGGVTDMLEWEEDAIAKAEQARDTATLAELGLVMRQLAARWSAFPGEKSNYWGTAAFLLTADAERIAPALEKSAEVLRTLENRAAALNGEARARQALLEWKKRALAARSMETLRTLRAFSPQEMDEAIDELEGFPRQKAAQADYERKFALLEPLVDSFKQGQNVAVAVRTLDRLVADGLMIHAWSQLTAVKAATLGAGRAVTLPTEPRVLLAVVRLLAVGSSSWEDDDDLKAMAMELSPVAQRLWESRETWRAGHEHSLMWTVRHYANMKQAWAVAAWQSLKVNPTPGLRLMLTRSGFCRELGVPPVTEAEAKLAEYVEADRAERAPHPPGDDPVTEFTALRAGRR